MYLVLYWAADASGVVRLLPYVALVLFAVVPFLASWLSEHPAPLGAAAGGLALGIGATVAAAAAIERGGSGAMPLALGVAVAGTIALRGTSVSIWTRLAAVVVIASYAAISERFVSAIFVYPLLGFADELADVFGARPRRVRKPAARS
jgi:hypothetical protein